MICASLVLFSGCKDNTSVTSNLGTPQIFAVIPDSGGFNKEITINGHNFSKTSEENIVTFNGIEAVVSDASETTLTALVPKGAGTGNIAVTVDEQTATGPEFTYLLTPVVSTLAGTGQAGFDDGPGDEATFNLPHGIFLARRNQHGDDELFVADRFNGAIRRITADGIVSTFVFNEKLDTEPVDLAAVGGFPVVTIYNRQVISFVSSTGMGLDYEWLAGTDNTPGFIDGTRDKARFHNPLGITTDQDGNIYIADRNNHSIRWIDPDDDEVRTFVGTDTPGYVNGFRNPRFNEPMFIRWIPNPPDCCGKLYVSEAGNHTIRSIVVDGGVTNTVAGNGQPGFRDGFRDEAQLNSPRGMAFDEKGNVFVADFLNNAIRKITPEGMVTTVIQSEGEVSINAGPRLIDGPAGTAQFNGPYGIAVGNDGSLFFTDLYSYAVRKIVFE